MIDLVLTKNKVGMWSKILGHICGSHEEANFHVISGSKLCRTSVRARN